MTGYYIPATWAEVDASGGYVAGSRVVSASHLSAGSYQVGFDRDVSGCAYQATSYYFSIPMTVEPRSGDARSVSVGATNGAGTWVDTQFHLAVTC